MEQIAKILTTLYQRMDWMWTGYNNRPTERDFLQVLHLMRGRLNASEANSITLEQIDLRLEDDGGVWLKVGTCE